MQPIGDDRADRTDAIEAIKQLKARYFRTMDTKDWDAMRLLFADDFVMDSTESGGSVVTGGDACIAFLKETIGDVVTVHHGHMPEIALTSPTTATGIWAMEDMLRWPNGTELHGFGHYHETYEKVDGTWRIKTLQLTRLRMDFTEPNAGAAARRSGFFFSSTGTYSGSFSSRMLNFHLQHTSPSSTRGGIARMSTFMFGLYIFVVTIIDFGHVEWQFFSRMSGRPIPSHWSTATQRLNVMMPTSGSGISNDRSNALPGIDVASIWRSFIQSATVLPVMPRYSALSFFTPGSTTSPQSWNWMSNIVSSP